MAASARHRPIFGRNVPSTTCASESLLEPIRQHVTAGAGHGFANENDPAPASLDDPPAALTRSQLLFELLKEGFIGFLDSISENRFTSFPSFAAISRPLEHCGSGSGSRIAIAQWTVRPVVEILLTDAGRLAWINGTLLARLTRASTPWIRC
jgi:hypothetical protein